MAASCAVPALAQNDEYFIIDLGVVNTGDNSIKAHGMNNKGQIVGELKDSSGENFAFVWLPQDDPSYDNSNGLEAGIHLLDVQVNLNDPGVLGTVAFDINDSGIAVGRITTDPGTGQITKPMVWDLVNSTSVVLDVLDDNDDVIPGLAAWAVNDDSTPIIVGGDELEELLDPSNPIEVKAAFIYDYLGSPEVLPTASGRAGVAFAVTDTSSSAGLTIAGFQSCPDGGICQGLSCHGEADGAYWDTPLLDALDIEPIGGDARVVARALNSDGSITGFGDDPNDSCRVRALYWPDRVTQPVLLPPLPNQPQDDLEASDIRETLPNDELEVVGRSIFAERALIWRRLDDNGQLVWQDPVDLNDVATFFSSFAALLHAQAINDNGWIAGWGVLPGSADIHAYVAVPPEDYPTSVCGGDFVDDQTMTPGNGAVNVFDLFYLLQNWGANPEGDLNGDGATDVFDLFIVLGNWGDCPSVPGQTSAVPLATVLTEVGLTQDDWDEFEYALTEGPEKDRENYVCWMQRYLSECKVCPTCPGEDPFD